MEKVVLYDHRGEEIPKRTVSFPWFPLIAMIIAMGAMAFYILTDQKRTSPFTFTLESSGEIHYLTPPSVRTMAMAFSPESSVESKRALSAALKAWGVAVGPIPRPSLWLGLCGSSIAIACADIEENRIILNAERYGKSIDPLSIMLHEVGHLYGVPHIQGDALMNAEYDKKVTEPTAFAIALAKVVRQEKEEGGSK